MKKNQLEIISKIRHKIASEEKHLVKVEVDRDILKVWSIKQKLGLFSYGLKNFLLSVHTFQL